MNESMYQYLTSYLTQEEINKLQEEMNNPTPHKGFFLNTLRISCEELEKINSSFIQDEHIKNLYRYDANNIQLGKSVLHEAGGIYIMDPSACIISTLLTNNEKIKVLDMCAAPGGKTISYAITHPNSLIIANDFSYQRAIELSKNVERMGLSNVLVTSYEPSYFINNFSSFFDAIILDAPCSGTGMFRKEVKMMEDWNFKKVEALLPIQDSLLECAYHLLKEGGKLVYSTCSFLKEEDEDRLEKFLNNHEDMETETFDMHQGYYQGTLQDTIHLLPHLYQGEGHFISLLRKQGTLKQDESNTKGAKFDEKLDLYTLKFGDETFGIKYFDSRLLKLKYVRFGVKITDNSKFAKIPFDNNLSRYLPSNNSIPLTQQEAIKYIKGEELLLPPSYQDGINIVSYSSLNIGYINKKGNRGKNCYPKGLRKGLLEI